MAKKNNTSSDEDWFEDYDDEEETEAPKKKSKGGRKKKSKAWMWVVAFVVVLALLLFVRFKYATPEEQVGEEEELEFELPPEDIIEEKKVPEPETAKEPKEYETGPTELGEAVVKEEDIAILEGVDTTVEPELFGNVACSVDEDSGLRYISLKVYNTLEEDLKISPKGVAKEYNTYFMIRGIVDKNPGCGTELLEPGEWTTCDKIGFDTKSYANVEGINRISVQVPGKTEALLVECPEE